MQTNKRKGGIIILTAFAAVFILGMTALVTDVGYLYINQSRLQTAVNAGWKAGFDRMMMIKGLNPVLSKQQEQQIHTHVVEVMKANGYSDEELQEVEVAFGDSNMLQVNSRQKVGLFFAKSMNFSSAGISANRENHHLSNSQGIVPLGIPNGVVRDISKNVYTWDKFEDNQEFVSEKEYILKLGDGDIVQSGDIMPFGLEANDPGDQFFGFVEGVEYSLKSSPGDDTSGLPHRGNFGALNLNPSFGHGGGAKSYENNITYGYNYPVKIGEQYYPETGNMAGPTIDSIDYRIANGLTNVLIPVVSDYGSGSSERVTILGFLNFTLVGTGLEGKGSNAKASVRAVFNGYSDADLGKQKHNYGIIDPDNVRGGEPDDYSNRFMYGYNGVIDINNRLIPESENKAASTDDSVKFRVEGSDTVKSNRKVIIPITDIGPEVGKNDPTNLEAETIYDLQNLENPNGAYSAGDYNFGSSVRVIGFAEFEIIDPSEYTREGSDYESGDAGDLGPYQPGQVRGKFIRYIVKPGEIALQ